MTKKRKSKILFAVTSSRGNEQVHPTGVWLEEFAVPYVVLTQNGFDVTVASPVGKESPIDPNSVQTPPPSEWDAALDALKTTRKFSEIDDSKYQGVVIPGGHGPLYDLAHDATLAGIVERMNKAGKLIGAICHGPAAFAATTNEKGGFLFAKRAMTAFSDKEEKEVGLDDVVPFSLEQALVSLGAIYDAKEPWTSNVVTDGNLITGQNPQSSQEFALTVLNKLNSAQG